MLMKANHKESESYEPSSSIEDYEGEERSEYEFNFEDGEVNE